MSLFNIRAGKMIFMQWGADLLRGVRSKTLDPRCRLSPRELPAPSLKSRQVIIVMQLLGEIVDRAS